MHKSGEHIFETDAVCTPLATSCKHVKEFFGRTVLLLFLRLKSIF
jgi:hypothetical protein